MVLDYEGDLCDWHMKLSWYFIHCWASYFIQKLNQAIWKSFIRKLFLIDFEYHFPEICLCLLLRFCPTTDRPVGCSLFSLHHYGKKMRNKSCRPGMNHSWKITDNLKWQENLGLGKWPRDQKCCTPHHLISNISSSLRRIKLMTFGNSNPPHFTALAFTPSII